MVQLRITDKRLDRPKTMDFIAIETNPVSNTWRVSGELNISQSSVVLHLHNLKESIKGFQIMPLIMKILQSSPFR